MISLQADRLHRKSVIVDGHSDILIPVTEGLCRLGEATAIPSPEDWTGLPGFAVAERPTPYQLSDYASWFGCAGQYHVPAFQKARVSAQVVAVYIDEAHLSRPVERALSLIAALHREIRANPQTLRLARTSQDILRAQEENQTALLLSFEGAEPLDHDLDLLDAYYALGLRMVGLTHSRRNIWADGTQMDTRTGGLTLRGRQLVRRLNELGIVIDLAHLNDEGFWEILELTTAPPVLSHTSLLKKYPGYRASLTAIHDAKKTTKLRALAARGGLVGIIFWDQPSVERIVDEFMLALDHVGEDHVALGSDFFSRERTPAELSDIGDLPRLTEAMLRRGLPQETIVKILGQNWLRVFGAVIG